MRFRFCGDLDCPDWVLAEISTLAKISSVKLKLICGQVLKDLQGEGIDTAADPLFGSLRFPVEHAWSTSSQWEWPILHPPFPISHVPRAMWSYEEKQSPLQDSLRARSLRGKCSPSGHANLLLLQAADGRWSFNRGTGPAGTLLPPAVLLCPWMEVQCLDSVSCRVDRTLSSSQLQQVNEPLVHLKLIVRDGDRDGTEPFAMTMLAEKFQVLLAELRQAHAMMKTLS
ncbi:COMM domain-containing protein 4 [Dermochelys coriacea]|uniref:COMM domain-containing protein 4 n=1 Tax=Dermochelys coriacea TaxID=27794 RepID=UPI001CA956BE|nr:COMM domain-containing protein 4 [Dermochelys coriacea]